MLTIPMGVDTYASVEESEDDRRCECESEKKETRGSIGEDEVNFDF